SSLVSTRAGRPTGCRWTCWSSPTPATRRSDPRGTGGSARPTVPDTFRRTAGAESAVARAPAKSGEIPALSRNGRAPRGERVRSPGSGHDVAPGGGARSQPAEDVDPGLRQQSGADMTDHDFLDFLADRLVEERAA